MDICYHCKAVDGLHPHEEACLENYAADEPAESGERNEHVHELFRTLINIVSGGAR
jgi:hypothetical protein